MRMELKAHPPVRPQLGYLVEGAM